MPPRMKVTPKTTEKEYGLEQNFNDRVARIRKEEGRMKGGYGSYRRVQDVIDKIEKRHAKKKSSGYVPRNRKTSLSITKATNIKNNALKRTREGAARKKRRKKSLVDHKGIGSGMKGKKRNKRVPGAGQSGIIPPPVGPAPPIIAPQAQVQVSASPVLTTQQKLAKFAAPGKTADFSKPYRPHPHNMTDREQERAELELEFGAAMKKYGKRVKLKRQTKCKKRKKVTVRGKEVNKCMEWRDGRAVKGAIAKKTRGPNTALSEINRIARQIRAEGGGTWREAVKAAGIEYRSLKK